MTHPHQKIISLFRQLLERPDIQTMDDLVGLEMTAPEMDQFIESVLPDGAQNFSVCEECFNCDLGDGIYEHGVPPDDCVCKHHREIEK